MTRREETEAAVTAFLANGGEVRRAERGVGLHLSRRQWRELSTAARGERAAVLSRHKPFDYLVIQTTWGVLTGFDRRRGKHSFKKIDATDDRARRLYDEGAAQRLIEAMSGERGCSRASVVRVRNEEVVS